jgi:undecaprenyl-diphosphatase
VETIAYIDFLVLDWLHQHRHSFLDVFFRTITWAGSLYLLLPLAVLLLLLLQGKGRHKERQLVAFSLGSVVLLVHLGKWLIRRPRPELHPGMVPLPADWSFPSAHAAQVATFCLCAVVLARRNCSPPRTWLLSLLAMIVTAGVGVSRIYLQIHYPTDVLVGIMLGCAVVAVVDTVTRSRSRTCSTAPGCAGKGKNTRRGDAQ